MKKIILFLFFVLFLIVISSSVDALLTDAYAYYSFDINVTDDSTFQLYNGSVTGVTHITSGQKCGDGAYALDGDGDDDFIEITTLGNLGGTMDNTGVSFSFWYNSTGHGSSLSNPYGMVSTGSNTAIWLEIDSDPSTATYSKGEMRLFIRDENDDILSCGINSDTGISDGNWHHLVVIANFTNDRCGFFLDNVQLDEIYTSQDTAVATTTFEFDMYVGAYNVRGVVGNEINGSIDEFAIYNRNITLSEISSLYNGGNCFNPFAPTPDTLNITSTLPANNSNFTTNTIDFNVTYSSENSASAYLFINGTLNETASTTTTGTAVTLNFTATIGDGSYSYIINVTDNQTSENSTEFQIFVDSQAPTIITDFTNDTLNFNNNITGQFNFSDNILLRTINITLPLSEIIIFNKTNVSSNIFQYNLSYDISSLAAGQHILGIYVADGHTLGELKDGEAWNPKNGLFNDYIEYRFDYPYKKANIKTYLKGGSIFDSWTTEKYIDRYRETVTPNNPKSTQTIIVESDQKIDIIEDPTNKYGFSGSWLVIGEHWKDFKLKDEPNAIVQSITKISDYKIEATITGIKNIDELMFESAGDLNIVQQNYTFIVGNFTTDFEDPIFSNFPTTYNLTGIINLTGNNITGVVPAAFLEWNGTNITASLVNFNETSVSFTTIVTPNETDNTEILSHRWHFNVSGFTSGFLSTNLSNQTLFNISVGGCAAPNIYPIVNFFYFDEIADTLITATNAFDFIVFDGTFFYNQTGSFNGSNNDSICTNVNPNNATYNWDMWGTITSLSAPGFVSRVIDIDEGVPFQLSNNPTTNISLFLIGVANSSTVKYNWLTTDFQIIDGTMRIFKCNVDGTKDLVESIPVISSLATANIRLLVQPYSYDIIIDGVLFTDPDGFTQCHVESLTELTFYVDVTPIDIATLIGLNGIPCTINKTGNRTALLTWGNNPENLEDDLFGCFTAWRKTISGQVEIFSNCTIEADFEREVAVPSNGNEYIVQGHLLQNSEQAICGEVSFSPDDEAAGRFGISGLLGAFFLFIGIALIYAGEGQEQVLGGGIGIVAAWFLGILNFPWIVVSAIIAFLVLVALIGRYTRKVP